ncbi:MAG TPA: vitamin K epoxide reductase family protein [Ktedonobacterales bacterium]|nr:vitamin K epoxide reductase family protein [Ktedonobacterales bacterium]
MKIFQGAVRQWCVLRLALVGAGIAIYLTTVHYAQVPLLCSAQGVVNCERVTSSSYSVVPGTTLPITLPGLAWFLVSAALAVGGIRTRAHWLRLVQLVWMILGIATVMYLVYVELVILHTLCLWCTAVHIIIFVSLLLAIVEYVLSGQEEPETEEEDALAAHLH